MANFEDSAGEYVGQVVVDASIVLGDDPNGEHQDITMSGMVRIREWPSSGYERRTLDDGRTQIDLEMVESRVEGQLGAGDDTLHITETTGNRNYGTLTQEVAGEDFPARFKLMRLISVETPIGRLHNEQPIEIEATLTAIPPVISADVREGPNVFEAVNTPVPLLNDAGNVAAHFSGDPATRSNCVVRMVSAETG
jgi:hypothetical protein